MRGRHATSLRSNSNDIAAYSPRCAPAQLLKYHEDCGPHLGGQVQCRIDESDQWKESTFRNIVALGDGRDDDVAVAEIAP